MVLENPFVYSLGVIVLSRCIISFNKAQRKLISRVRLTASLVGFDRLHKVMKRETINAVNKLIKEEFS